MARMEDTCANALTNRLRLTDYIKAHPDVVETPIDRPLFIMGMPHSGTTLVSCLVGQDPARRSLLLWEAWDSMPPPPKHSLTSGQRITLDASRRGGKPLGSARARGTPMAVTVGIKVYRKDGVGVLTISNPERRNAFTPDMRRDLAARLIG